MLYVNFFIMNIDYRSIAIFLHYKGLNATQIKDEIWSVFGPNCYSYGAITKAIRLNKINGSEEQVQEEEENFEMEQKITCIKKTLNDFPFSSLTRIAVITKIPKTTVFRILTEKLGYVKKSLRWIPN